MASTGKKIATGCGIGCLLLALIFGGIGTCGVLGVRKIVNEAEEIEVVYDDLERQHGSAIAYVPAGDGRIDPARLELFLAIRDSVLTGAAETIARIELLDGNDRSPASFIQKARAGMELVPGLIRFRGIHSRVLLEQGMGLGEYAYLYALSFFVLLDNSPGAGPDFTIMTNDDEDEGANVHWSMDEEGDPRERREREARENLSTIMRHQLQNQLAAADRMNLDPAWRTALQAEVDRLTGDWERLAWEDGLPEPLATSLAPYREALAARWEPYLNPMESQAFRP